MTHETCEFCGGHHATRNCMETELEVHLSLQYRIEMLEYIWAQDEDYPDVEERTVPERPRCSHGFTGGKP